MLKLDLIIGGVGAGHHPGRQGLTRAAQEAGYDIRFRRFTAWPSRRRVVTQCTIGKGLCTSDRGPGGLLAFERLEGLRLSLPQGRRDRDHQRQAIPRCRSWWERRVRTGSSLIAVKVPATLVLDALGLATGAAIRAINMVLLGALAEAFLEREIWERPWRKTVPEKFLKVNKAALLPATNKEMTLWVSMVQYKCS